jgi:hypothetical protein
VDRNEAVLKIKEYDIPQVAVAKLAGVWPQDVNGFCSGLPVSKNRIHLIISAVSELVDFIQSLQYPPDFRNFDRLRDAVALHRVEMVKKHGEHAADSWLGKYQNGAALQSLDETGALAATLGSTE